MNTKVLFFLCITAFLSRLLLLFQDISLWWDSFVYLSMAKYLASAGTLGLWEHIRPPLLPFLLSVGELVGNAIFFNFVLQVLLSLGCCIFTFLIAKHHFSARAGIFAFILVSWSSIFFFLTSQAYTEILAVFFILLGYLLYLKKYFFSSGLSLGLAFLAKFPSGMFFLIFLLILFFTFRSHFFVPSLFLSAGFFLPLLPYFLLNFIFYGSIVLPFVEGNNVIHQVLGCNTLFKKSWWYYVEALWHAQPLLYLSVIGFFLSFKKLFKKLYSKQIIFKHLLASRNSKGEIDVRKIVAFAMRKNGILILSFVVPLVYFTALPCKDERYILFFLPFIALFAGEGIAWITQGIKKSFCGVAILILFVSILFAHADVHERAVLSKNSSEDQVAHLFSEEHFSGTLLTTHPRLATLHQGRVVTAYYPVYNNTLALQLLDTLLILSQNNEHFIVYLDTCSGGMICPLWDAQCSAMNQEIFSFVKKNTKLIYQEETPRCTYLLGKSV